jgi:hypothetical protein
MLNGDDQNIRVNIEVKCFKINSITMSFLIHELSDKIRKLSEGVG